MTCKTIAALAAACIAMPANAADLSGLAWLEGCWSTVGGEKGSQEQWMAPAGGSMLGMARIVSKGKTVQYEFMRLAEREDGKLALTVLPSGQAPATFALVRTEPDKLVFEGAHTDFPTRIIYRRGAGGQLHGRIEGKIDGKDRAVDFPMQRAACSAV